MMTRRSSGVSGAALGCVLAATLLTGCMVGPDYKAIDPKIPSHWTFSETAPKIDGAAAVPAEWWKQFNDPVLTALVSEAMAQNLDLQAAGLRVLQARSGKVQAWWLFSPAPILTGSATHMEMSKNVKPDVEISKGSFSATPKNAKGAKSRPALDFLGGGRLSKSDRTKLRDMLDVNVTPPSVAVSSDVNRYSLGGAAAWEPDIWGSKRRGLEENTALVDSAIASYDDMVVVLTSDIASNYIHLRAIEADTATLDESIKQLERLEKQARSRGGDAIADADQAKSLLEDARATRVGNDTLREIYSNALCTLLGKNPGELKDKLAEAHPIPRPADSVAVGLPADLLRRRPDVRFAEREAAAQCARIGRVKSMLYPSFSLMGALGYASSQSGDFFQNDSKTKAYGGMMNWNILLYPFIQEQARVADAKYHEAILAFQSSVLRAAEESQNAIVNVVNTRTQAELLAASAQAARSSSAHKLEGYEKGGSDFNGAFASLSQDVEQSGKLIDAQGRSALAVVNLYAALGGGWETQSGKPLVPEDTKKAMQDETDWWSFGGKGRLDMTR